VTEDQTNRTTTDASAPVESESAEQANPARSSMQANA
jgi:hypothetical protein